MNNVSWNWREIQNLERNRLVPSKLASEIWKIWPEHSKVLKNFTLMCSHLAKYIFFQLKKNREIMFHKAEERHKIWRGINLLFQNWHKEFDKIWPGHSKISKTFIFMGSYWAKYILFELKKYWEIIFHETGKRYKIWRGIALLFQIWHKEFDKTWPEHSKISEKKKKKKNEWAPI